MRILTRLSYLGTNYHGWQVQPNGVTVQETVQNAIEQLIIVKAVDRTPSPSNINLVGMLLEIQRHIQHHLQRQSAENEMLDHMQHKEDEMIGISKRVVFAIFRLNKHVRFSDIFRTVHLAEPHILNDLII